MCPASGRNHSFTADASALSMKLTHPPTGTPPLASVTLPKAGGGPYNDSAHPSAATATVLTFATAESKVSGAPTPGNDAWLTVARSEVKGLNICDGVTADSITACMNTTHLQASGKYAPALDLTGTGFQNLVIKGHAVTVVLDLGPYTVLHGGTYPAAVRPGSAACSIVKTVTIANPSTFPGTVSGNKITVQGCGDLYLGEFTITPQDKNQDDFHLTMLRVELNASAGIGLDDTTIQGQIGVATAHTNGSTQP